MSGRPAAVSISRSEVTAPIATRGMVQMSRLRWGGKVRASMTFALPGSESVITWLAVITALNSGSAGMSAKSTRARSAVSMAALLRDAVALFQQPVEVQAHEGQQPPVGGQQRRGRDALAAQRVQGQDRLVGEQVDRVPEHRGGQVHLDVPTRADGGEVLDRLGDLAAEILRPDVERMRVQVGMRGVGRRVG